MPYTVPTFDSLLNGLLTDYQNQFPEADTSQGSLIFIKCSALASALWGLYKHQEYISRQLFPDSADAANLQRHADLRGLPIIPNETQSELLIRLLEHIRRPPAGGNQYDYVRWAKESSSLVSTAWCVPLGQGPGTVDVIVLADAIETGSEIPDAALLATVRAYMVDLCPINIKYLRVLAPEVVSQDVTIVRTAADYPAAQAAADIAAYLDGFLPGQTLYLAQLAAISLGNGSGDAAVTAPAAAVVPLAYQMLRPGVISVA